MAETNPKSPTAQPNKPASKGKNILIFAGVAVLAIVIAYAAGRMQTSFKIDAAEQAANEKVEKQTKRADELAAKLADSEAKVAKLEARRHLSLTLMAMDNRNFGIAQKHLEAAAKVLKQPETKAGKLGELSAQIAKTRLVATENMAKQREKITGWMEQIDDAVPPKKL